MKRYKLKRKTFIILMFCISILFLFTFNVTSSRYMGELVGSANDVVAIPIISLDNPNFTYEPENMLPGSTLESDFYVNNYENDVTNEVSMKYYLKIKLDSVIPLTVTLTDKDGTKIVLDEENKTKEYELPYKDKMREKYHIKIEWNEKDNSYEYAGKDIKLTIDLISTQVVEGS